MQPRQRGRDADQSRAEPPAAPGEQGGADGGQQEERLGVDRRAEQRRGKHGQVPDGPLRRRRIPLLENQPIEHDRRCEQGEVADQDARHDCVADQRHQQAHQDRQQREKGDGGELDPLILVPLLRDADVKPGVPAAAEDVEEPVVGAAKVVDRRLRIRDDGHRDVGDRHDSEPSHQKHEDRRPQPAAAGDQIPPAGRLGGGARLRGIAGSPGQLDRVNHRVTASPEPLSDWGSRTARLRINSVWIHEVETPAQNFIGSLVTWRRPWERSWVMHGAGGTRGVLACTIHEVSAAAAVSARRPRALLAARHPRRTVEHASGGSLLR